MYIRCLLYQACVFNFGNEFCKRDPNPGNRYTIQNDARIKSIEGQGTKRIEALSYFRAKQKKGEDFILKKNNLSRN